MGTLDTFIHNEYANQQAMINEAARKGRNFPPPATLSTAKESLDQMPDDILTEMTDGASREYVTMLLNQAVSLYGPAAPLDILLD